MTSDFVYVALGDSTAVGLGAPRGQGYVDRLVARMVAGGHRPRVHNFASNGATSQEVAETQLTRALAARPALVTVFVGSNDLWRGVPPDRFAARIADVGARLRDVGARVVMSNLADLSQAPIAPLAQHLVGLSMEEIRRRIPLFNARIGAAARASGQLLVDLHGATVSSMEHGHFCADGFHPSGSGHEALAAAMWPVVERAIAELHGASVEPLPLDAPR